MVILGKDATSCAYCVFVNTLRNSIGDCTNGGETAHNARFVLYTWRMSRAAVLLDAQRLGFLPSEVLHACRNEVCGEYVADVITRRHAWHMAGGNFVFSPDARYREVTGVAYPISVHDRVYAESEGGLGK